MQGTRVACAAARQFSARWDFHPACESGCLNSKFCPRNRFRPSFSYQCFTRGDASS
jgi:hypothetical protein